MLWSCLQTVRKNIPPPGVSDHEMIFTISDVRAKRLKPTRRKILLWKKADMDTVRSQPDEVTSTFLSTNSVDTPVNDVWSQITSGLHRITNDLVPFKMPSTRFNQPWTNRHLKRLLRRKKKAYNKARRTELDSDWLSYRELKKMMQRESRNVYNNSSMT